MSERGDEDKLAEIIETQATIGLPAITVNVDFNDLIRDEGEPRAWELLGKLKDLMS